jgi:prepilin-type N-terminal cleavage/methylation domain-containing protein
MNSIKNTHTAKNPPIWANLNIPISKGGSATQWSRGILAFTLVELIVVVTILAILATIWFVSYSSYLTGVRDTNRLAQLVSISDGLELYRTRNDLPLPDDNVEVQTNGTTIAYQWYVWSNTLETIDFTKGGKDPKDDQYFSYYLTKDRKYFQLMAFLEEEENITAHHRLITTTNAVDYSDRFPVVYWKKLWILTDVTNRPIQEISIVTTAWLVDFDGTGTEFVWHIDWSKTQTWNSISMIQPAVSHMVWKWHTDCKNIIERKSISSAIDGVYWINPTWVEDRKVYCDMTTDWGWWTYFMYYDSSSNTWSDFFETATGTYLTDRSFNWEPYSITSSIFKHTEMMVILDDKDPIVADANNKIVFFQYSPWHSWFNLWPIPCTWLADWFNYKAWIWWLYTAWWTTNGCDTRWYTRTAGNAAFIVLFNSGSSWNYWGTWMGWNNSWSHDAWWYLR